MADFVVQLEALLVKATLGECAVFLDKILTKDGGGRGEPTQELVVGGTNIARLTIYSKLADGELLSLLRNHAPALLDVVKAANELQDRQHWMTAEECGIRSTSRIQIGPGNRLATALRRLEE
jgi:hypothetical protein